MHFVKMHGCGNDFIVTHEIEPDRLPALIARTPHLCDRRRGIGADGLVLVQPSDCADMRMRIINADGTEAEMCGNGIRCAFTYARDRGLLTADQAVFETAAGNIVTEGRGELVRVMMGPPTLSAPDIPTKQAQGWVIDTPLEARDRAFAITAVSMGNPHAVIFVPEPTDELVLDYGPIIESHPFFPRHTNVEFVKIVDRRRLQMRVFERGVGETLACGTGACAAAVAAIVSDRAENQVTVHLSGGELAIEWDGSAENPVFMTGPAVFVYEGDTDY